MEISEMRDLSVEELNNRLESLKRENFNLRFRGVVESIEDNSIFAKNRKEIARIKTVINERQEA